MMPSPETLRREVQRLAALTTLIYPDYGDNHVLLRRAAAAVVLRRYRAEAVPAAYLDAFEGQDQ